MSSMSSKKNQHTVAKRPSARSTSSVGASRPSVRSGHNETDDDNDIEYGSENVWADLGYLDAQERKVKDDLAFAIRQRLESLGVTQVEAARALGISQPKVSQIVNLHTRGISVERLAAMLTRLGATIEVKVTYRKGADTSHAIVT